MPPRSLKRLLLGTAVFIAAGPAAAQAATITADGDALVYHGTAAASSLFLANSYDPVGKLRFEDSSTTITSFPGGCVARDDNMVDCEIPASVQVEFGSADDSFGLGDGYTLDLPVSVNGGGGDDRLYGDADRDNREVLDGGPGRDVVDGFGGDDEVRGGDGDDQLEGNGGADVVLGGGGNDTLAGDDQATPGADVIDGGAGNDLLKDYVEYATDIHPPASVSLDGVANDGRDGEGDNVTSVERMIAYVSGRFELTDGAEEWQVWSNMDSGDSVVDARGGNDRVIGEDNKETIDGGAGDDYLEGGKGHDVITGGPGMDTIYGDETDSSCNSSFPESCVRFGNDVIDARDGEVDQVDCGPGTDSVKADASDVVSATCETVDRGAGKPDEPTKPVDPAKPPVIVEPKPVTWSVVGKPRLRAALRKGLRVKVSDVEPGTLKLVARQGRRKVGSGKATVGASGTATVRVKFTKAAVKRLRRARKVKLTVAGGGASTEVTLKR